MDALVDGTIDDLEKLAEIAACSETSDDPTGNWIGPHRPRTNVEAAIGKHGIAAKAYARWSATHYAFYDALIERDDDEERSSGYVVDLGCAGGARTLQLARRYGAAHGIDRNALCIDFARKWNGASGVTFLRADWPCDAFHPDRIYAVEFFEHFAPDAQRAAIVAALKALDKDGRLLMTLPNEPPGHAPHLGTMQDAAFDALLASLPARIVWRDWFDNAAPGDPCDPVWTPYGRRPGSHHAAILAPA
jgi:SAM-dependent methyltransferase